jgi:hypothetical protein
MIINRNINPERDLYYLGGKVIEVLSTTNQSEFDYFELYRTVNQFQNISVKLYILVLDWLFILNVIRRGPGSLIEKCF